MFNLSEYEGANDCLKRFKLEFPTGRIEVFIEDFNFEVGYILVKALAYRNYEDEKASRMDYAFEFRATHGVNLNFWVENCVTSALARVVKALTPSGISRSSREDMEKVERLESMPVNVAQAKAAGFTPYEIGRLAAGAPIKGRQVKDSPHVSEALDALSGVLGAEVIGEQPKCEHGYRIKKEGISDKTKKPYLGYACTELKKAYQCQIIWYKELGGKWLSPEDYALAIEDAGRS